MTAQQRPEMSAPVRLANLTGPQRRAVVALIDSGSVGEAAAVAKVSSRTIRRWLTTSTTFREAYRASSRASAGEALSALLSAQSVAVQALRDALGAESAAVRVRAARAILEVGARVAVDDLDERLDDLEREVAKWHAEPRGLTAV